MGMGAAGGDTIGGTGALGAIGDAGGTVAGRAPAGVAGRLPATGGGMNGGRAERSDGVTGRSGECGVPDGPRNGGTAGLAAGRGVGSSLLSAMGSPANMRR